MGHKNSISVHTLVKNEERFIWYSVMSVIPYVDEIKIWDTGSTDNTLKIIREIQTKYPDKIDFREVGKVDVTGFTAIRQKMLDETNSDWILLVDGDEVWWKDSIKELVQEIENDTDESVDAIVTPFVNVIGDIFHFQDEAAGKYNIDGRVGNITIRAFRRGINNLHLLKDYGQEGYVDDTGRFIQESGSIRRKFIDKPFLHLTHLRRSQMDGQVMQRKSKYKYELGIDFPKDFYYPEVFFEPRPLIVKSPWKVIDTKYKLISFFETPLRKIKRRLI